MGVGPAQGSVVVASGVTRSVEMQEEALEEGDAEACHLA